MGRKQQAAIDALHDGQTVVDYKEGGNSMTPIIYSNQPVTLQPIVDHTKLRKKDIVLVKVKGNIYTHLISGVAKDKVQISNNHGHVNGWTPYKNVYGIVTAIGDTPRRNSQYKV